MWADADVCAKLIPALGFALPSALIRVDCPRPLLRQRGTPPAISRKRTIRAERRAASFVTLIPTQTAFPALVSKMSMGVFLSSLPDICLCGVATVRPKAAGIESAAGDGNHVGRRHALARLWKAAARQLLEGTHVDALARFKCSTCAFNFASRAGHSRAARHRIASTA